MDINTRSAFGDFTITSYPKGGASILHRPTNRALDVSKEEARAFTKTNVAELFEERYAAIDGRPS